MNDYSAYAQGETQMATFAYTTPKDGNVQSARNKARNFLDLVAQGTYTLKAATKLRDMMAADSSLMADAFEGIDLENVINSGFNGLKRGTIWSGTNGYNYSLPADAASASLKAANFAKDVASNNLPLEVYQDLAKKISNTSEFMKTALATVDVENVYNTKTVTRRSGRKLLVVDDE